MTGTTTIEKRIWRGLGPRWVVALPLSCAAFFAAANISLDPDYRPRRYRSPQVLIMPAVAFKSAWYLCRLSWYSQAVLEAVRALTACVPVQPWILIMTAVAFRRHGIYRLHWYSGSILETVRALTGLDWLTDWTRTVCVPVLPEYLPALLGMPGARTVWVQRLYEYKECLSARSAWVADCLSPRTICVRELPEYQNYLRAGLREGYPKSLASRQSQAV